MRDGHHFKLPQWLTDLIESGDWPSGKQPPVVLGVEAARKLSSDDDRIELMPAPFHTIADEVGSGNNWWIDGVTNASEIDYELALIIADFGIGSDSPVVLYYRSLDCPTVMYLRWSGNGEDVRQSWIETHRTFDAFAEAVGLPNSVK